MRNIIDDNEGDIVSGTDNEKEKGRSEKIWRVLVITILTVVFLYIIYHVFSYFLTDIIRRLNTSFLNMRLELLLTN